MGRSEVPILVLEKEFIFSNRRTQLLMVQDQVGTFGASNETRLMSHPPVRDIDPRSSSIDNYLWVYPVGLPGQLVTKCNCIC